MRRLHKSTAVLAGLLALMGCGVTNAPDGGVVVAALIAVGGYHTCW